MQVSEKIATTPAARTTVGRLIVLELSGGRIFSVDAEGRDKQVLVTDCYLPDGIAVDVARGHIYWTNMGDPKKNDGSIERVDLDGKHRRTIVPVGATHTPKQLQLAGDKLYWCDREGMKVMRCSLDGTAVETLVSTGSGDEDSKDARNWCVGIAVDPVRRQFYWTQKGGDNANEGRIFRAAIDIPALASPDDRPDIELLYGGLPEPIDLELDLEQRVLYWTDRGDPPRGNTVNRAPMDVEAAARVAPEIVFPNLMEGIGIALDAKGGRMFITDFGGNVFTAALDGSDKRVLMFAQGNLTGVAYAPVPAKSR
jgi:DNA-binding beta-propeller fold protein YncE